MFYIFVNCIADGPVDWKKPLTAKGQPDILEAYWIVTDDNDLSIQEEAWGRRHLDASAADLKAYSDWIARGAIVVGHSVEYHHGHMRAEMIARGIDPCDGRTQTVCTMMGLADYGIKAGGRSGWPKFQEACDFYGITRAGVETAEDNARALLQVFKAATRAGVVFETYIWKERHTK